MKRLCGHCGGSGSVGLRTPTQDTLDACRYLAARGVELTAAHVAAASNEDDRTRVATRLRALAALGMIERAGRRRPLVYRLTAESGVAA